jgi:hypothetical protein
MKDGVKCLRSKLKTGNDFKTASLGSLSLMEGGEKSTVMEILVAEVSDDFLRRNKLSLRSLLNYVSVPLLPSVI